MVIYKVGRTSAREVEFRRLVDDDPACMDDGPSSDSVPSFPFIVSGGPGSVFGALSAAYDVSMLVDLLFDDLGVMDGRGRRMWTWANVDPAYISACFALAAREA